MKKLVLISFITLALMSCATHHGTISSASVNRKVTYEDMAMGVSQSQKCFGLGGRNQDALVLEAKRELIKNRPLKSNEQYLNFTIDIKKTTVLIYHQTKVTVSADVVKFTNDSLVEPYSELYKSKLFGNFYSNDLFKVGDTITDGSFNKGVILSFLNKDKVRIFYRTSSDKLKTKTKNVTKLFTNKKEYNGLKVGDKFIVKDRYNVEKINGTILALGYKSFIIKNYLGIIQELKYKSFKK